MGGIIVRLVRLVRGGRLGRKGNREELYKLVEPSNSGTREVLLDGYCSTKNITNERGAGID